MSHTKSCQASKAAPANFQQLSQPGPMLWTTGLRETESLWIVILHADGSLSAPEKVVILFGKVFKGKINEYSAWM